MNRDNHSTAAAKNGSTGMSRRGFLQTLGAFGAGVTLTSLDRGLLTSAAAQAGARSLVCVFLAGGADSHNMVVPLDHDVSGQTHDDYARTRGAFAVPAGELLGIGDGSFGLHPALTGLHGLADRDRLATLFNVGPLELPIDKADYAARRATPQNLFAHDAQQKLWQTGRSRLVSDTGWGGAIASNLPASSGIAPAFSLNGSNVWQGGAASRYTQLSPTVRIERLLGHDASLRAWIPSSEGVADVLSTSRSLAAASASPFDAAMADAMDRSIAATEQLRTATTASEENDVGMDDVGGNKLGLQLRTVARLIKNRDALGMGRQVFFVRMGGWDTHRIQSQLLPRLLGELNNALVSFHASLDDLGVADSVTTFTASDFGRTLTANGDGTDHGWGGNAFVMGGAVAGGTYGTLPSYVSENNPDDVGDRYGNFAGRLIPTTSVSQYGATLAGWMGLGPEQLVNAFPDIGNFAERDLGFMS